MGRSSNTTEVKVPEYLENAARQNIDLGNQIAEIGYVPYYGPDVAAMTPMQMAAGDNIGAAASAFGLAMPTSAGAGMPAAIDYNGIGAYSSGALYDQALAELQQRAPAQFEALRAMFIDPVTGAGPSGIYGDNMPMEMSQPSGGGREGRERIEQARERSGPNYSSASNNLRAVLPGGVNDPRLERPVNQAIARAATPRSGEMTSSLRPIARPNQSDRSRSSGMGGGK
jgi:hypothetical protein